MTSEMRWPVCVALAALAAGSALAGTPERDQDWDALIAEAKKHGGEETQYQNSVSYVFFRKSDGEWVTFTRMLDSPTRAVCVLSKPQTLTVCGNWDTGKLRYGLRSDANSQWSYSDDPPAEETRNVLPAILGKLAEIMNGGKKSSKRGGGLND